MAKGNLSRTHPQTVLNQYSDFEKKRKVSKIKHFSTDGFESGIKKIKNLFSSKDGATVISNVASGDEPLSIYSNLALTTSNIRMVVIDRSIENLQNMIFKTVLANISSGREEYTELLTGNTLKEVLNLDERTAELILDPYTEFEDYEDDPEEKSFLKSMEKQVNKIRKNFPTSFLKGIDQKKYSPHEHFEKLSEKASEIANDRLQQMFLKSAETMVDYFAKRTKFPLLIDGLANTLKINSKAHYLSSDDLFTQVKEAINITPSGRVSSNIHFLTHDISTKEGIRSLDTLLKDKGIWKKGKRTIDIAYVPHLMRMPDLMTYLRDNGKYVISTTKGSKSRNWNIKPSSDLPVFEGGAQANPISAKYKKDVKTFSGLEKVEEIEGLPSTAFLSGLNIGYKYSDEEAIAKHISAANESGVQNLIISGLLYGQYLFQQNERRQLNQEELKSLDSKLKRAKQVIDSFNGNVTIVPGDGEGDLHKDLFNLYFWEKRRRAGDKRIARTAAGGLLLDRDAYNETNDLARNIINEDLIPYLIRNGGDSTIFLDQEGEENKIVELIDSLERYKRFKSEGRLEDLLDEDLEILNLDSLKDTDKLTISQEYSKFFPTVKDNEIGLRVISNTKFSKVTQYVTGQDVILTKSDLAANEADGYLKEKIFMDGRQALMWMKATNGHLLMTGAHMTDDSKYHDPNFLPGRKTVLADPVHKRQTIRRSPNLPASWGNITGDHRYRMYLEPLFPKIIENMEQVQKSGQGYGEHGVVFIQDTQIGSLTEDLKLVTLFNDYAFNEQGCDGAFVNGDILQGRNYPDMPNENRVLGGVTLDDQSLTATKLFTPFIPLMDFCDIVPGNHEWNTDKFYLGINFLNELRGAINMYNQLNPENEVDFQMPNYTIVKEGDVKQLMKSLYASRKINGLGNVFGHKWSAGWGGGKGSGKIPSTFISSWVRSMGEFTKPFDFFFGAHYHGFEAICQDNKFGIIQPSFAGESGYEFARQFAGNKPMGMIAHYKSDGRVGFEIVTDAFLNDYYNAKGIQNKYIKKMGGLDKYIEHCVTMDAPNLMFDTKSPDKKMYRRKIREISAKEIK